MAKSNSSMEVENVSSEMEVEEFCRDCVDGICDYRFPTVNDFRKNGIFSNIKLPIPENQENPKEVMRYIYGKHYQNGDAVKPRHYHIIRENLNKLADSLTYNFPSIEDFKEGGKFSHVKFTKSNGTIDIPEDVFKFTFGSDFENVNDLPYQQKRNIQDHLAHLDYVLQRN